MTEAAQERPQTYGEINYKAYYDSRAGLTYDFKPIPKWEELGEGIRQGWEVGAQAVILAFTSKGDSNG